MKSLRKNALMTYLQQASVSMEADVQDGKLFRERERVIYARLKDVSDLHKAASADFQEQWSIKQSKTEDNQAKGQVRVRKIIQMVKEGEQYVVPSSGEDAAQYVLTAKAEKQADDRLEVPAPVTKDMFELFKLLASGGMIKHRFHFPLEDDLVFEVDAFLNKRGEYHDWVKIDLEMKDKLVDLPELPFEVSEKIFDTTSDASEKKKIGELYENVFTTTAAEAAATFNSMIGSVATEGFIDNLVVNFKDLFKGSLKNIDDTHAGWVENEQKIKELTEKVRKTKGLRSDNLPAMKPGAKILNAFTREGKTASNIKELFAELSVYEKIVEAYADREMSTYLDVADKIAAMYKTLSTDAGKAYKQFESIFKDVTPKNVRPYLLPAASVKYFKVTERHKRATKELLGGWGLVSLVTNIKKDDKFIELGEIMDYVVRPYSDVKLSSEQFEVMDKDEALSLIGYAKELNTLVEPLTLTRNLKTIRETIEVATNRFLNGLTREYYYANDNDEKIETIIHFTKLFVQKLDTAHLGICGEFYRTVKALNRLCELNMSRLS